MLKEYAKVLRSVLFIADVMIVIVSFVVAHMLVGLFSGVESLSFYLPLVPSLVLIWGVLLNHFGMYHSFRARKLTEVMWIVLQSAAWSFLIFCGYIYVAKITGISRIFIGADFLITTLVLLLEKTAIVIMFHHARRKGFNFRRLLIVGSGKRVETFINTVSAHSEWGLHLIGLIDRSPDKIGETVCDVAVIGTLEQIPQIVQNRVVDEVVFIVPRSWLEDIEKYIHFLEIGGIRVSVAVDYFELQIAKAKQTHLYGFPLLTFESAPDTIWLLMIKRACDIIGSLVGLVLLAPVFLVCALLVYCSSPGPILFRQIRSGRNGRLFTLYKFRTMVVGAEGKLEELRTHNEMKGPVFKMENDPRVTKVGKYLRKLSLDELPQLWNVFVGDMSLVGPRPALPSEIEKYEPWQRRRLSMRPGITCLWQVKGRNTITDFDTWMKLDLEYIDNWSLTLDANIVLQTIPVVLFGIGAK
jgi:exopolysaccharide biosynthesis polyprenyl glycosylphosphotransferase